MAVHLRAQWCKCVQCAGPARKVHGGTHSAREHDSFKQLGMAHATTAKADLP